MDINEELRRLNQLVETKKLCKLIQENPELSVVPVVDSEVVGDKYGDYTGDLLNPHIGEYAILDDMIYDDRGKFKHAYYKKYSDELCEMFDYDPQDIDADDTDLGNYLEAEICESSFKEAIILYIYNSEA